MWDVEGSVIDFIIENKSLDIAADMSSSQKESTNSSYFAKWNDSLFTEQTQCLLLPHH